MGNIRLNVHVDAQIDRVLLLLSQIEHIPDWQYDILEVKDIEGRCDRVGAQFTVVYWRLGRRLDQRMEITRYDPPEIVEQTANTPLGGRMTSATHLEASGGGTDIHWQMRYRLPGWFIGDIVDWLFFRAVFKSTVRKYLANFKALAEGETPPHPSVRSRKAN